MHVYMSGPNGDEMNCVFFNNVKEGKLKELIPIFTLIRDTDEDRVRFAMEFYFWLQERSPEYDINTVRVIVERMIFYCVGTTNTNLKPWTKILLGVFQKMKEECGETITESEKIRHLELL